MSAKIIKAIELVVIEANPLRLSITIFQVRKSKIQ
jgi:hypothetical protein